MEAQGGGEIVTDAHKQGTQNRTLQSAAQRCQQHPPQQAGSHGLEGINGENQQPAERAIVPAEIGKSGVAASVAADIIVGKKPGNQNGTVKISQKIAGKNDNDYAQNHAYCSSLSPFWRMVMRTGVPMRPKTSRIWFSRYR